MNPVILALLFLAISTTTFGAELLDQPYEVVLKLDGATVKVESTVLRDITSITGNAPYLSFNCRVGVDCRHLVITLGDTTLTAEPTSTERTAKYRIPLDRVNETTATALAIGIKENDTTTPIISTNLLRLTQPTTPPTVAEATDIDTMLKNPCTQYLIDHAQRIQDTAKYDEKNNLAVLYITPDGTMITDPPEYFDDNDTLELHIIADAGFGRLSARRTSPLVRRELHIVGEERRSEVHEQALEERLCGEQVAVVSYFDAPRGEVQIRSARTVLGSFELPVNRRYWGMYSLGPVRSQLGHREFKLVTKGDQHVIASDFTGKRDIQYALFLTPFWSKRDIEKPLPRLSLKRLNPSVGITLQHAADNILVGATYDIGNVLVTGGRQWTRIATLDPASGLVEGSPFTGTATEIPTVKQLKSAWFIGVSLDLRAALGLLTSTVRGTQ